MERGEMNLVLAVCYESLQWENSQWQISVFDYKHQGEGRMKVITFEYVRQATLMRVRKKERLKQVWVKFWLT